MILRGSWFSKALEMQTGVTVVGPDHETAGRPYWVCYLLHGLCGNHGDWAENTLLPLYAQAYNVLFITPEVGRSFYADMQFGQKFFTYVQQELPELCARYFHVSTRREDSFVIGGSMGGYGALKCALTAPGQYIACCALSSCFLFLDESLRNVREHPQIVQARVGTQAVNDLAAAYGPEFHWAPENDLLALARSAATKPEKPRLFLACGKEDSFLESHRRFQKAMQALPFELTYRELPGRHDWYYFDRALKAALTFCFGADDGNS